MVALVGRRSGAWWWVLVVVGLCQMAPAGAERTEADEVGYKTVTLEMKDPDCKSDESCFRVAIAYPKITRAGSDAARDAINAKIYQEAARPIMDDAKPKSLEEKMDQFLRQYLEVKQADPEAMPWYAETVVKVERNAGGVLCVSIAEESSTGGAHPNGSLAYFNFTVKDGKPITLADVFAPGADAKLTARAEAKFRKDKELAPGSSLEDAGFTFAENKFRINNNFALGLDGIAFYYNSYEIAPYAMGPTELKLSWAEVKDLLKKDGLIKPPK